jgi:hypothetical protein
MRCFEDVQVVGIAPTGPENWASPDELSATGTVLKITFGPGGTMQIIVPMTEVTVPGVPIELPPACTSLVGDILWLDDDRCALVVKAPGTMRKISWAKLDKLLDGRRWQSLVRDGRIVLPPGW